MFVYGFCTPGEMPPFKLSALEIDIDKDWQAKGISNIKELATNMAHGDILDRGSSIISRVPAGDSGKFLQTCGANKDPWWSLY